MDENQKGFKAIPVVCDKLGMVYHESESVYCHLQIHT